MGVLTLQIFDGDLFDFEMEVEPMLEVLVGRALEQGLMEVQEEKQLEHLRCHQVLQTCTAIDTICIVENCQPCNKTPYMGHHLEKTCC